MKLCHGSNTKCCGDPVVVSGDKPCAGKKNGVCTFTISQTICVEVPVEFGAKQKFYCGWLHKDGTAICRYQYFYFP